MLICFFVFVWFCFAIVVVEIVKNRIARYKRIEYVNVDVDGKDSLVETLGE